MRPGCAGHQDGRAVIDQAARMLKRYRAEMLIHC
jgi:hypothetical protein